VPLPSAPSTETSFAPLKAWMTPGAPQANFPLFFATYIKEENVSLYFNKISPCQIS
jgi:hypothetical protein